MQALVTRMELDLIGQRMLWVLGKRAICDGPQATKSAQFLKKKIAHFISAVKLVFQNLFCLQSVSSFGWPNWPLL